MNKDIEALPLDRAGMAFLAQIIDKNARDADWTSGQLIKGYEARIEALVNENELLKKQLRGVRDRLDWVLYGGNVDEF